MRDRVTHLFSPTRQKTDGLELKTLPGVPEPNGRSWLNHRELLVVMTKEPRRNLTAERVKGAKSRSCQRLFLGQPQRTTAPRPLQPPQPRLLASSPNQLDCYISSYRQHKFVGLTSRSRGDKRERSRGTVIVFS
jgi:hypothetical protein